MQAKENQREAEADREPQSSERKANKQADKARQKAELDQSKRSYVWAIKFLKPYKKQIAALAACGTMAVIGETLTPKMIQYIIDHVVINKDTSLFIVILSALTAVNLLMLIAKNYRNLIQRTIGELASRDMQTAIFKHLRKLGFAHYERHPAGETLSMFNSEVASVQKIYRNYLPGVIDNILFITVAVVLLVSISGWLSLIMLPTFALYYLFGTVFQRKAALQSADSPVKCASLITKLCTKAFQACANSALSARSRGTTAARLRGIKLGRIITC